jgi:hypothetical protein
MNSLWAVIRKLFVFLRQPAQRRASGRRYRRKLFPEPLESRALPSAGALGGGGPLGGRGKSVLAPGQASLPLSTEEVTHGPNDSGRGGPQATQVASLSGPGAVSFSPSGPGYPLPPAAPPRTGGDIGLAPQLNAVLVPFGGSGGALSLVPTQSTFALSAAGNLDALAVSAQPSVPTQATFASSALGTVDAVGAAPLDPVPTQATFASSALGTVANVLPIPRFDAATTVPPASTQGPASLTANVDVNGVSLPAASAARQEVPPTNAPANETQEPLTLVALGPQGRPADSGVRPETMGHNTESFWSVLVSGNRGTSESTGEAASPVLVSPAPAAMPSVSGTAASPQGNLDRVGAGESAQATPSRSLTSDATANPQATSALVQDAAPAPATGEQSAEYVAPPQLLPGDVAGTLQEAPAAAEDSAPATAVAEHTAAGDAGQLLLIPALLVAKTWWDVCAQRTPVSLDGREEQKRAPQLRGGS